MVNSSEIKRIYGEETYRRGKQYYDDGHVVTAVKLKDVVVGEILGTSKYNTAVNLSRVYSTCSCPVGTNCKHGVALMLQYLSGDFIDADEIMQSLQRIDRSGILNVLEKLFKEDPSILLKIRGLVAPSEKRNGAPNERMVISVEKQVRGMLKHLERKYGDKQFADTLAIFIRTNEPYMDKSLLLYVLDFLVKKSTYYGGFYDYDLNNSFGEIVFENLCDALVRKSLNEEDLRKLAELIKRDELDVMDAFLARLAEPDNAKILSNLCDDVRKLLEGHDPSLYMEFLINAGKSDEARRILRESKNPSLNETERFDLYLKINIPEAIQFARERKDYSSLISYYHEAGEHSEVINIFRSLTKQELVSIKRRKLYIPLEEVLQSLRRVKPEDQRQLMMKLFDICYSDEEYDLCVDIAILLDDEALMIRLLDIREEYLLHHDFRIKLLKRLSKSEPKRSIEELREFADALINEKEDSSYELATKCIKMLKELMSGDDWGAYLTSLYREHYRKVNLWSKLRRRGIEGAEV